MVAEGEQVVWSGRPSWRGRISIVAPGILVTAAVVAVLVWADVSRTTVVIIGLVLVAVTVVWALLETLRWKYTITDRRVFVRHGLVSINEQTARLERVQDLTLHQTLFDRLFGVGTLQIDTAGSEGGPLEFKALTEPTRVREILDSTVRSHQPEPV
ncbi:MAG TPA: PH domain-containing protein [Gaiellaceae bacterium]|nr:PH domain-containing protein [Gaiellaceae bacterium]